MSKFSKSNSKKSDGFELNQAQKELLQGILENMKIDKQKKIQKCLERLDEDGLKKAEYESCKKFCTRYIKLKDEKFPVCSDTNESFDSYCHLKCEKDYVSSSIEKRFDGACDDPNKTKSYKF